jgi:hypothetical protein
MNDFNKNYLNHNLIIYNYYKQYIDLYCEKCNYFIYFDTENLMYTCTTKYLNAKSLNLLSCSEMIIKKILE